MSDKNISIRSRLIVGFMGISIIILVLCVILAYRIARDISESKEEAMTIKLAGEVSSLLLPRIDSERFDQEALISAYSPLRFNEQLIIIANKKGDRLYLPPESRMISIASVHLSDVGGVDVQADGKFVDGNKTYSWATLSLDNNLFTLTLLRPLDAGVEDSFRTIVLRLIITAGVILWGSVWVALGMSSWITRRLNKQNEEILYQALHDNLTGFPNRTYLYRRLSQTLKGNDGKKSIAVYVLDLDRFKEINDTLGHSYGDDLLKQIASRLDRYKDSCDIIARLGGDEFAILHINEQKEMMPEVVEEIIRHIEEPFTINGIDLHVKGSLGVAMFPEHGKDAETLIRHAEVAMYKAKETKKGFSIYEAEQDPYNLRRLTLIGELKQAVQKDQLILHYQPKLDLNKGTVSGVEALVRWQHPRMGLISPAEFISIAEQTGLIKQITMWVIRRALLDYKVLEEAGIIISMAVNLSSYNLYEEGFYKNISSLLADCSVPSNALELEITESVMMGNPEYTVELLKKMNYIGLKLSIDDFGTGFSSFAYLQRFPISQLKIDRSFVMDMESNPNDRMIVQSIIDLAHNLNFKVVAEGVENESTIQVLKSMGCDLVQGYAISRPVPLADLILFLSRR